MLGSYSESNIHLKFYGTKIRIIGLGNPYYSDNIKINIDGKIETFNEYDPVSKPLLLVYQKTGLSLGVHDVVISAPDDAPAIGSAVATKNFGLDAVDIDSTGYLVKLEDVIGVGDKLFSPEDGWNRFDDRDPKLIYSGEQSQWLRWDDTTQETWNRTETFVSKKNSITIKFYGSEIRLIGHKSHTSAKENFSVVLDGVETICNVYSPVSFGSRIFYENKNLESANHTLVINYPDAATDKFGFDCLDTDGVLLDAHRQNLISAIPGDKIVTLNWELVSDATNYIVKRALTPGGPYETITTTSAITYTDTNVTNGTTYYYIVTAIVNGVESGPSNEASATPNATTNPEPSGNSAILEITMVTGEIKEYDLTTAELRRFFCLV